MIPEAASSFNGWWALALMSCAEICGQEYEEVVELLAFEDYPTEDYWREFWKDGCDPEEAMEQWLIEIGVLDEDEDNEEEDP